VDWDGLLAAEGPAVWRAVRRVVGNDADAEDVFQETFVAAVELSRREPVRQWRGLLLRLAHARGIDRLRARYRRGGRENAAEGEADVDALPSDRPGPDEVAAAAELSARLRDALAQLPARQAEVFCLFCLEGWTYQQVSEHLAMSSDAVGVTIHRARARLRTLLGEPAATRRAP
jgi:RNA polymerase sigma-70 factor (ECF subfamily)